MNGILSKILWPALITTFLWMPHSAAQPLSVTAATPLLQGAARHTTTRMATNKALPLALVLSTVSALIVNKITQANAQNTLLSAADDAPLLPQNSSATSHSSPTQQEGAAPPPQKPLPPPPVWGLLLDNQEELSSFTRTQQEDYLENLALFNRNYPSLASYLSSLSDHTQNITQNIEHIYELFEEVAEYRLPGDLDVWHLYRQWMSDILSPLPLWHSEWRYNTFPPHEERSHTYTPGQIATLLVQLGDRAQRLSYEMEQHSQVHLAELLNALFDLGGELIVLGEELLLAEDRVPLALQGLPQNISVPKMVLEDALNRQIYAPIHIPHITHQQLSHLAESTQSTVPNSATTEQMQDGSPSLWHLTLALRQWAQHFDGVIVLLRSTEKTFGTLPLQVLPSFLQRFSSTEELLGLGVSLALPHLTEATSFLRDQHKRLGKEAAPLNQAPFTTASAAQQTLQELALTLGLDEAQILQHQQSWHISSPVLKRRLLYMLAAQELDHFHAPPTNHILRGQAFSLLKTVLHLELLKQNDPLLPGLYKKYRNSSDFLSEAGVLSELRNFSANFRRVFLQRGIQDFERQQKEGSSAFSESLLVAYTKELKRLSQDPEHHHLDKLLEGGGSTHPSSTVDELVDLDDFLRQFVIIYKIYEQSQWLTQFHDLFWTSHPHHNDVWSQNIQTPPQYLRHLLVYAQRASKAKFKQGTQRLRQKATSSLGAASAALDECSKKLENCRDTWSKRVKVGHDSQGIYISLEQNWKEQIKRNLNTQAQAVGGTIKSLLKKVFREGVVEEDTTQQQKEEKPL